jgi:hypothetical protein
MHRLAVLLLCALVAVAAVMAAPAPVSSRHWGTIKGRVVFDGTPIPANPEATVKIDKEHCLSKGPIKRDELVVNPKNRGVRWVLVWLAPVKDFRDPTRVPPIHPSLKDVSPKKVEIDQPVCRFVPHMVAVREGTTIVFKNSAPIHNNVRVDGWPKGPYHNALLHAKTGVLEVKGVKARLVPFSCSNSMHPWMKGWVGVFRHPYYAITDADGKFDIQDAPIGQWRLMLWQEKVGWVINRGRDHIGRVITIKGGHRTTTETVWLKDVD